MTLLNGTLLFHFLGGLLVTWSPVTCCQQDPKNSAGSPPLPKPQSFRAEGRAQGGQDTGQQSFDRAERAAPVCHVTLRPCSRCPLSRLVPGSDPRPFLLGSNSTSSRKAPSPTVRPPPRSTHWPNCFVVLPCNQSPTVSLGEHPESRPDYLICPDEITLSSAGQRTGEGWLPPRALSSGPRNDRVT